MKLAICAVLMTSASAFMAGAPQRVSTRAPVAAEVGADVVAEAPEEPKYPQINGGNLSELSWPRWSLGS